MGNPREIYGIQASKNIINIAGMCKINNFVIDQQLLQKALPAYNNKDNNNNDNYDKDVDDLHIVAHVAASSGMQYLPILLYNDFEIVDGISMTRICW